MNIVFTALTLISLVLMTFTSPSAALPTMIEGVRNAILLTLKLTAIYAVWLSVLKMMEATGLDKKLSRGLRPVIKRLFKGESEESYNYISVNLASNMLGMGGATTPAGINAMASMCKEEGKASDNMLLLLVINATSIQIFPATVIALRATDRFSCYTAAGITAVIAVQTVFNIAVVCGAVPPTGLPLPFISAGGTSLVAYLAAVGVLLSVSRYSCERFLKPSFALRRSENAVARSMQTA